MRLDQPGLTGVLGHCLHDRHQQADLAHALAVASLDQRLHGFKLLLERHHAGGSGGVVPARVFARMRRSRRANRHDVADSDAGGPFGMGNAVRWVVGAHHAVPTAEQRHPGGDAEHHSLQSGQLRLRAPEFRGGGQRVDNATSLGPGRAVAAVQAFHQTVPGVTMAVDESGQDHVVGSVDHLACGVGTGYVGALVHRHDAAAINCHGTVFDDRACGVDLDDRAAT